MAELIVRTKAKSALRTTLDSALSVSFPVWGIGAPIVGLISLIQTVAYLQGRDATRSTEYLIYFIALLTFSVACLLMKRLVSYDVLNVDKQGIKLPVLLGTNINIKSYIPWKSVKSIQAVVSSENTSKSVVTITKTKGRPLRIPVSQLEPEFIEQFLLATKMWAPNAYHESLDNLQSSLRLGAKNASTASYTELWEDELARRFNPTNYVPLEVGKVLRNSSLKIVRQLASGGLSALYLCQMNDKNLVVLKEAMIPQFAAENVRTKAREMFAREAKLLMQLDNSSIVKILDCFTETDRNYMILEYVNGIDLRQLVKQNGPQKESEVLDWAIQIAIALKYLHEREEPIVHRDLTPDNIVLRNDGKIVIVDFGAANELIGNATGTFVGKHAFIAPEQLRGKANVQSDIYAFGCTLFFLLTGEEPEALSESVPKIVVSSVSDELSELVESCTKLECSERYQTIAQLLPVLRRLTSQIRVS